MKFELFFLLKTEKLLSLVSELLRLFDCNRCDFLRD